MSHPGLQSLDLDACFIACRTEGDTEIMTADLYVFPWRERLSFRQECFMLFRLTVLSCFIIGLYVLII